jgi:hypothetical protein
MYKNIIKTRENLKDAKLTQTNGKNSIAYVCQKLSISTTNSLYIIGFFLGRTCSSKLMFV